MILPLSELDYNCWRLEFGDWELGNEYTNLIASHILFLNKELQKCSKNTTCI